MSVVDVFVWPESDNENEDWPVSDWSVHDIYILDSNTIIQKVNNAPHFQAECPIEMEHTQCVKLKCNHSFGVNIITKMINTGLYACPLCRKQIDI